MSKPQGVSIHLTQRALQNIVDVETWSIEIFGRRATTAYLKKLEAALNRIKANPELLRTEETFHESLKFYRVEKHLLVCETAVANRVFVLAVVHASMDIPLRLCELEPTLKLEVAMLVEQLRSAK